MDEPQSLLSPAPACEPTLGGRSSSPSSRERSLPRTPRHTPHDGRSGTAPRRAPRAAHPVDLAERQRTAREFAERAMRLTLEVLDHRRAPSQLRPMADPSVIDVIRTLATVVPQGRETARLHRIHVLLIDPDTAEVFGTYLRGPRVLALAARLALRPRGWRISTVHIG